MKNIIILMTTTALLILVSCKKDFLERYPLDKITAENFWKSGADVLLYANQFYPSLFDARVAWYNTDNRSDNQVPGAREAYTWDEYTIPSSGGGWNWQPIRNCNLALDNIERMNKDQSVLTGEAEIRFFKAFFYFDKLKRFGEIPWLSHGLNINSEELTKPRDSREIIVDSILKEIDFAVQNLPKTSNEERLTKYAALALKTQICLYEGTFRKYHNVSNKYDDLLRKAVDASVEIINSGLFKVYNTGHPEKDYFNLFVQDELKGNPEGILIQRYLDGKRMHNNGAQLYQPNTGYSLDFVQSYLCKDGLPIVLSSLYEGDQNFKDAFQNRDPRMNQSVYDGVRPLVIYDDGTIVYRKMPEFNTGTYSPTSYFVNKGSSPYIKDILPQLSIIDDFIFRYGKVLLDYAEANAELGECTQEVLDKSINLLRDRVGMPHLTVNVGFEDPNWPKWEIPISPLLNEIRRERRIETCAEGNRWDDIVRWKAGRLLENPKTILGARDPATGDYRIVYKGYPNKKWDDKLYLFPIPTQELALNTNLTQNPGWE